MSTTTQTWDVHHPLDGWNIGKEVKGVTEEQRLSVGDGVNYGEIGVGLRFVLDLPDVTDGETVEEVHEDNNDQDDEGKEVDVTERHEIAVEIYGDVREL